MNNQRPDASDLAELVGKLALHQHLCLIYATQEEQFSAAIPFLKIGLGRGEKCIYVADAKTTAAVIKAMRADGMDVDAAIRQGSFAITKGYPLPGNFVPDGMVDFLAESVQSARLAGYSALRVIGEMTWVTGIERRPERLMEFEAKVNHVFRDHDALAICQYDRRVFPPEVLLEILRTHPTVVYGGCICENPYYVPAEEYLNPDHHEREIERMLSRMREDTASREKLRQSERELLRIQDKERRKIARDLHDSTGQNLVALATMLGQLRGSIPSKERKARRLLSECKALVDRCIGEVRTLSYVLHPPALDETGLIGAIREYVRGFTRRTGIHVELELSPRVGRTAREVELALFRVVQESLTNIQRHSGSQHAKIRVDRDSNLTLEISDYRSGGSGTLPRDTCRSGFQLGVGIRSMQERVNLIGGRLEIDTTNHGTAVRVTVPVGDGHENTKHSGR